MDLSERIKSARKNTEKAIADEELEKQKRITDLRSQIKGLTPRIEKLMSIANDLVDNGFFQEFLETKNGSNNYYSGFCSEGWAHRVGFVPDYRHKHKIEYMGIVSGGAYGNHDFLTNGKETFMTTFSYEFAKSSMELSISDAERFVRDFDKFEKRFYKELDAFLKKKGA